MNKLNILFNKIIPSSDFVRNITTVASGTLTAQVISVVTLPILSRLFSPGDFGTLGLFLSISSIVSVIPAGRYEFAIMLPSKENEAYSLSLLAIIINICFLIATLIIVSLFHHRILFLLNDNFTYRWLYFVPIGIFMLTFFNIMNYWNNRQKQFKFLAISRVYQSIVNSGTGLIFGFMNWSGLGLILGSIFSNTISSFYLFFKNKIINPGAIKYNFDRKEIIKLSKDYSDFPKKSIPGALLNMLSWQLPVIIIGSLYNISIVGYYNLTMRVLSIPMNLLGTSVSQVYYQRAVEASAEGNLNSLVKKTTIRMFLLIIIPMAIIFFSGEYLFSFIFGDNWSQAGRIAEIMCPFFIVRFIFSCQSTLMMVLRRLDFEFLFNLIFFITQILSLLIGYYFFNDYIWSFVFMSGSGVIVFLWLGFFIFKNTIFKKNTI